MERIFVLMHVKGSNVLYKHLEERIAKISESFLLVYDAIISTRLHYLTPFPTLYFYYFEQQTAVKKALTYSPQRFPIHFSALIREKKGITISSNKAD